MGAAGDAAYRRPVVAALGEGAALLPELLRELPATGLESARVLVDGDVYLADRRNYLTTSYDRLQPGAWMAN